MHFLHICRFVLDPCCRCQQCKLRNLLGSGMGGGIKRE